MKSVYNKKEILSNAWALVKSTGISFKEALIKSWFDFKTKLLNELDAVIRKTRNMNLLSELYKQKASIKISPISIKCSMSNLDKQAATLFYTK